MHHPSAGRWFLNVAPYSCDIMVLTAMQITDKREIASEMKDTLDTLSPFIEKHTAVVCPECAEVCCADRHGRYDSDDLAFLRLLGIATTPYWQERDPAGSCRHMTESGCSLQRWLRPYRCTFYFCDSLLKSLEQDNSKLYRAFIEYLRHLLYLRQRLAD